VEIVGEGRVLKAGEARPAVGRADSLLRDVGREPIAGHSLECGGNELKKLSQHHPHGRAGDPRQQRHLHGQGIVDGAVPEAQGSAVEHESVQDQVQGRQKRLHKQEEDSMVVEGSTALDGSLRTP
jgi:hypothetical protein